MIRSEQESELESSMTTMLWRHCECHLLDPDRAESVVSTFMVYIVIGAVLKNCQGLSACELSYKYEMRKFAEWHSVRDKDMARSKADVERRWCEWPADSVRNRSPSHVSA